MDQPSRHRAPRQSPWSGWRGPRGRRLLLAAAGTAVAGALVATALTAAGSPEARSAGDCPADGRPLEVVAAPEIAPAVSAVVRLLSTGDGADADPVLCDGAVVRAEAPAQTLAAMKADLTDRPDVWIPDSSAWTYPVLARGAGLPVGGPSVATSPFVLAAPATGPGGSPAGRHGLRSLTTAQLLDPGAPVRWALPDPAGSPSAAAAVLALREALAGTPGGVGRIAQVVRAGGGPAPRLDTLAGRPVPTVLPVTEQRLLAWSPPRPEDRLVAAYSAGTRYAADYPYVVLATTREARGQAAGLRQALRGDLGRRLLASDGFRDPEGVLGAAQRRPGIDSSPQPTRVPTAAEVGSVARAVAVIRRPSRVLAVVDVSGSMAQPVDATGESRLSLALQGLLTGLAAYPDDTVTGLWTFSTRLTPRTDYRELVPLVRLGVGPDGTAGRSRLAQALTQVQVRVDGGTALYDTTWAAVRAVRKGWDPARANAVVVVTDGANHDPAGLRLPGLLRRLRADDGERPVPVYGVAIGPDADLTSLTAVARATGGHAYTVLDPRQVVPAIADAVGRRS